MARTYRKHILCTICNGDNRDFYRCRRRKIKNLGRMQLRRLIANYDINEVSDLWEEPKFPMKDTWSEPTDGHWGMSKEDFKKYKRENPDRADYYEKEAKYYLKNKKYKY